MGTLVRALSGGDHARCMLIALLVVFLHGGPGGGFDAKDRSFFDPTKYKVCVACSGLQVMSRV